MGQKKSGGMERDGRFPRMQGVIVSAPKALSAVTSGEGVWRAVMSSPVGAGAEFRPETHFDIFWDDRAVLADRKVRLFCAKCCSKLTHLQLASLTYSWPHQRNPKERLRPQLHVYHVLIIMRHQYSIYCCEITTYIIEMDRMSDYDIRPKPKVWTGSPNECLTFGRTSAECCMLG